MSDRQSFLYSGHKLSSGGANDPLLPRLVQAINHATEIEISVSFIQPSGLDLLFDPLFDAVQSGAQVKLLTSEVSRPPEPPQQPLAEPYVNLSAHTAPIK